METLPVLVLDNIFAYLTLSEKLDCFSVSPKWSSFVGDILTRQTIIDLSYCDPLPDDIYRCPNSHHQPLFSDRISAGYMPKGGLNIGKLCPNIKVIHGDCAMNPNEQLSMLELLIVNLENLICVHLPYFGCEQAINRCVSLLIRHHSKSLRHLLIKDQISEMILCDVAKNLVNLEFLAIHHPTLECEGYENWPRFFGSKFSGIHIDSNFDDRRVERILKPLLSRPTVDAISELVLTTESSQIFSSICQSLTGLRTLILYSDEFRFPDTHKLCKLQSLRLATNTDESTELNSEYKLLRFIGQIPELRSLVLENFEITSFLLKHIHKVAPKLESLVLCDNFRTQDPLGGDNIVSLLNLRRLRTLTLEVDGVDLSSTHLIKMLNKWPKSLVNFRVGSFNLKLIKNLIDQLDCAIRALGKQPILCGTFKESLFPMNYTEKECSLKSGFLELYQHIPNKLNISFST